MHGLEPPQGILEIGIELQRMPQRGLGPGSIVLSGVDLGEIGDESGIFSVLTDAVVEDLLGLVQMVQLHQDNAM